MYVACKETILDKMRTTLSRIVVLPEEQESDEDLYDICRAYGLLLNVCKSQSQEHQVSSRQVSDMASGFSYQPLHIELNWFLSLCQCL